MTANPTAQSLIILGYHHIGPPSGGQPATQWYLPERTFEEHLIVIQQSGWSVITVEALLERLAVPGTLPEHPLMLTFDDCHRSLLEVALPLLQRFGYPAVAFAPTDYIGLFNTYDADYAPREPLCGWDHLRLLQASGISIQSHSATHRGLSWLSQEEREEELARSKLALESELSGAVEVFAYPYGDAKVERAELESLLTRTGYRAACLFGGGANRLPVEAPYYLERIAIEPDTDLRSTLGIKRPR